MSARPQSPSQLTMTQCICDASDNNPNETDNNAASAQERKDAISELCIAVKNDSGLNKNSRATRNGGIRRDQISCNKEVEQHNFLVELADLAESDNDIVKLKKRRFQKPSFTRPPCPTQQETVVDSPSIN